MDDAPLSHGGRPWPRAALRRHCRESPRHEARASVAQAVASNATHASASRAMRRRAARERRARSRPRSRSVPGKNPRGTRDAHEPRDHGVNTLYPPASVKWKSGLVSRPCLGISRPIPRIGIHHKRDKWSRFAYLVGPRYGDVLLMQVRAVLRHARDAQSTPVTYLKLHTPNHW